MTTFSRQDFAFSVDLTLLLVAAPVLFFPDRFPEWTAVLGIILIGIGWLFRRTCLGKWYAATPADLPILFLVLVMLPISIWAAPPPLREQYSIPRTYILVWSLCLFAVIVTYGSLSRRNIELAVGGLAFATLIIAAIAPMGIAWLHKLPGLRTIVSSIPSPLINVFSGAESGFHPNQVAGTLLYALPMMVAISACDLFRGLRTLRSATVSWLIWIATPIVGGVFLLTQSRSSLLALAVACLAMILIDHRWGRRLLLLLTVALLIGLPFIPPSLFDAIGDAPTVEALGGVKTLSTFRTDVWMQAYTGLHDFPYTGMGFGTFREILFLLYPTKISPFYNVGHAHNFFLQTGLDFGLPGLIAVIAIHLIALLTIAILLSVRDTRDNWSGMHVLSVAMFGSLVAHLVYSQIDAVAIGAKTSFLFWYLFALVFTMGNWTAGIRSTAQSEGSSVVA